MAVCKMISCTGIFRGSGKPDIWEIHGLVRKLAVRSFMNHKCWGGQNWKVSRDCLAGCGRVAQGVHETVNAQRPNMSYGSSATKWTLGHKVAEVLLISSAVSSADLPPIIRLNL